MLQHVSHHQNAEEIYPPLRSILAEIEGGVYFQGIWIHDQIDVDLSFAQKFRAPAAREKNLHISL